MKTTRFMGFDCIEIGNAMLSLLVTQSVGPRILSLRFGGGENLLAVLPDFVTQRPDGKIFHFYGGHRLWHAPENMLRTYSLDDEPVEILPEQNGVSILQAAEEQTGIEKSIQISFADGRPQVTLCHTLRNPGLRPVECAPWAITQFRTGGVAILPQSQQQTDVLPNRSLALWPYTCIESRQVRWGDRYILVHANMQTAFKVGFSNPRGWLGYWLDGTLFVKRAAFDPQAAYYDFGSSSECYCNSQFLELETLAPAGTLEPGKAVTHVETWELHADVELPENEDAVQHIVEKLGLE